MPERQTHATKGWLGAIPIVGLCLTLGAVPLGAVPIEAVPIEPGPFEPGPFEPGPFEAGALQAGAQPQPAAPQPTQPPAVSAQPAVGDESASVRLEIRVFDGNEDVTSDSRVRLFPRGQRTNDLPMTVTPGQPVSATVPVGFYDAQAIREKKGQVAGLRWAEQLLVQRYPDEHGRHLEVINFRPGYGALQIRPARDAVAQAKGWAAVAYAAGDQTKELGKAVSSGEDLVLALPGGTYDVKVTLSDKSTQWIRDVEVPGDRTRLKTWSPSPASR